MTWLREYLYKTCPGVTSLPMLELVYHITVSCQTLQRHTVLHTPAGLAPPHHRQGADTPRKIPVGN